MKKLLVVIAGPTATGKSKLGLDLALKYGGEIINADSMQIYKGLNIATNKISELEQNLVNHHLINFANPYQDIYHAYHYKSDAQTILHKVWLKNTMCYLVGGTNYYIESLLWETLPMQQKFHNNLQFQNHFEELISQYNCEEKSTQADPFNLMYNFVLYNIPTNVLYDMLKNFDPIKAQTLHPNDRRKIIRSLKIIEETGVLPSSHLYQKTMLGGKLIYKNCIMFWLDCDVDVLKMRIDNRINEMVNKGLLVELKNFYNQIINIPTAFELYDKNKGIFQNIGLKEFEQYFKTTKEVDLEESLKKLKLSTLKYAKRQLKWIKNRYLIRRQPQSLPIMIRLDVTNVNSQRDWDEQISQKAMAVIQNYFNDNIKYTNQNNIFLIKDLQDCNKIFKCDFCQKSMIGKVSWDNHCRSRGHKYILRKEKASHVNTF